MARQNISRRAAWAGVRSLWFQLHWFIGITAGTVLIVIGLTGASLAFRDEILDAMNPGVRQVEARAAPVLTPPALLDTVRRALPPQEVVTLTVYRAPGACARVIFAPRNGAPLGESRYLDPYTGALRPKLRGGRFFDWMEGVHRWLLLPRPAGQATTGTLAGVLLFLSMSGLYLRWPRRAGSWRTWLTFDTRLEGRSFLKAMHSVVGTFALLSYLVLGVTGLYWGFDAIAHSVDAAVGAVHPQAAAPPGNGPVGTADLALAPAWSRFETQAGGAAAWREVIVRIPTSKSASATFTWLDAAPAHDRARNRMIVHVPDAQVLLDDRYAAGSAGTRFVSLVYGLHLGGYFGLPGRVAMGLSGLLLPGFAITGWLMYLSRRPPHASKNPRYGRSARRASR